ncbi:MAG: hypothetical protein CMG71_07690 [Candidatus Marinimicrobia bacterium]|nr:hypothetical protein [Candidatus Neomarinimicrobiota bacterium]
MNSNLLTVEQVAKQLVVTKPTVYNWIKEGFLKSIRFGRNTIRIAPDDLKTFIDEHSTNS